MAAGTGLSVVKRFTYRGDPTEEWGNTYWLTGAPPTTSQAWRDLFDNFVADERTCYADSSHVVRGLGYDDDTPGAHAVWTVDLEALGQEVPGNLTSASTVKYAGDQAGVLEWLTERKSSRGKWIYLRKYFHDGFLSPVDADRLAGETALAYEAFGEQLLNGSGSAGRMVRSQRQTETLVSTQHLQFVTTRTLKRRGKRP